MFLIVVSLFCYLFLCAKVGKHLQEKSASMRIRHLCGLFAFALDTVPLIFLNVHSDMVIAYGVLCGVLGYLTIVYRPKWIVGNR